MSITQHSKKCEWHLKSTPASSHPAPRPRESGLVYSLFRAEINISNKSVLANYDIALFRRTAVDNTNRIYGQGLSHFENLDNGVFQSKNVLHIARICHNILISCGPASRTPPIPKIISAHQCTPSRISMYIYVIMVVKLCPHDEQLEDSSGWQADSLPPALMAREDQWNV